MVVGDSDGVCGKAYFFCKKCSCLGKKSNFVLYVELELEDSVLRKTCIAVSALKVLREQ